MIRFSLALLCFVLIAGCGGDPHSRMVGEWQLDKEAFKTTDEYKKMSDMEKQMAENMLGAITVAITKDTLTIAGETSTYIVKEQSGDTIKIESTDKKGKKDTVDIRFDGDLMIIAAPESPALTFKRKE